MDNNDDVIEMLENHKLNTEQIINEMVRSLKEANKRLKMTQDEDGILELKAKLSTMEKENSCLLEHNQHHVKIGLNVYHGPGLLYF